MVALLTAGLPGADGVLTGAVSLERPASGRCSISATTRGAVPRAGANDLGTINGVAGAGKGLSDRGRTPALAA
jgi:hypothetical protein